MSLGGCLSFCSIDNKLVAATDREVVSQHPRVQKNVFDEQIFRIVATKTFIQSLLKYEEDVAVEI